MTSVAVAKTAVSEPASNSCTQSNDMDRKIIIRSNTKIAELIKADKTAIDALAAVAKPFQRLRNPILRKVMAPRVTIAEAAQIGGCSIEAIALALEPLGFQYEGAFTTGNTILPKPKWLQEADAISITRFDVRPIIESGNDPLKEIMARFKTVPPGGILCIINSFVPTPLIHLLEQGKTEGSYVETISSNEFHTWFLKKKKENSLPENPVDLVTLHDHDSFYTIYNRFPEEKIITTDVRHLEMPLPMQTILEKLATVPKGHMLFVHHKRMPVYLLEELAGKNYEIHVYREAEGNVKMIFFERT